MNIVEYQRMEQYETSYWWHVGRLKIIEKELERQIGDKRPLKILNIGCGTGGTIRTLEKFGQVVNVDVSDEAIKFMAKHGFDNIIKVDGIDLPFDTASFDLVCAFDVLEHIDRDTDALREWKRVLKPGGKLVLTVPAYQWLWSCHDECLHHFRRYNVGQLKTITRHVHFRSVRLSYAIAFSFPLVVGFRMLAKLGRERPTAASSYVELSPTINKLFTKLLFIEASWHRVIKFPFGTSILAVFKK